MCLLYQFLVFLPSTLLLCSLLAIWWCQFCSCVLIPCFCWIFAALLKSYCSMILWHSSIRFFITSCYARWYTRVYKHACLLLSLFFSLIQLCCLISVCSYLFLSINRGSTRTVTLIFPFVYNNACVYYSCSWKRTSTNLKLKHCKTAYAHKQRHKTLPNIVIEPQKSPRIDPVACCIRDWHMYLGAVSALAEAASAGLEKLCSWGVRCVREQQN